MLGGSWQFNDQINAGFIIRSNIELIEKFKDVSTEEYSRRGKQKLYMPLIIGLAGSYKLNDKSTVFGEYQSRNFSDWTLDGEKINIYDNHAFKLG